MQAKAISVPRFQRLSDYWALTKPGVMNVVVMTTLFGFFLGSAKGSMQWGLLFHTLLGTTLAAAGASMLNMFLEIDLDARMDRTKSRPLPAGRTSPRAAFFLGSFCACLGIVHLGLAVGALSGFLTAISLILYLVFYTPLKLESSACLYVGSVAGAIPPLIGFSAAAGTLTFGAWTLFAILFLWQFPHLMALAWMYKSDYAKAGFKMVPYPEGNNSGKISLGFAIVLFAVSLLPFFLKLSGVAYALCAVLLSGIFLFKAYGFARKSDGASARSLFFASIFYMPLLLAVMAADSLR